MAKKIAPHPAAGGHVLADPSLWGVVLGNGFASVLAITQGWTLGEVLWIYWGQSVIIGLVNFYRMISLKAFSTEGLTSNGRPVPETHAAKYQMAFFFLVHYGFFHAIYVVFLWEKMPLDRLEPAAALWLLLCILGFAGVHGFSFWHNLGRDFQQKKPNLGTIMFYPYLRIIPMHLTIIFGGLWGQGTLLLFMGLKTLADAGMHSVEHALFRHSENDG